MQITSSRMLLRPVLASDIDDLFRIYGDPETNRFNPAGPYPDRHHAESVLNKWLAHWDKNVFGHWAISLRESPERVLGFGGLSSRSFDNITINNLGYRFATEAWGKGLATEFSQRAVQYGFEELGFKEISASVRENHLVSQNVLKKAGLRFCRTVNDVENADPSLLFTITADEYRYLSLT